MEHMDHIAWLTGDATVSNAIMEVLSVNPPHFRDTVSGREFRMSAEEWARVCREARPLDGEGE